MFLHRRFFRWSYLRPRRPISSEFIPGSVFAQKCRVSGIKSRTRVLVMTSISMMFRRWSRWSSDDMKYAVVLRRQHANLSWPLVRPVFPYRILIKKARFSTWLLSLPATTISGTIKLREQALGVVQKDVQSRSHRASTIFPTYPKAFRRWWLRCCYNWRWFVGRWGSFFPLHINPSRSASDILRCPISGPYHVLFI